VPDRSPRRLSAEQRREQLLDAALALAADRDLASVSVEELAAAAGVSEGLLYHYFPTKQALAFAALRRAADAFLADVRAATGAPESVASQLAAGLAAYLDHVQAQPVRWRALLSARSGDLAVISVELEAASRELLLATLDIDNPSDVLIVALAGWAALERDACLTWLDHPAVSRQALENLLLSTFTSALTTAAAYDFEAADALDRLVAG